MVTVTPSLIHSDEQLIKITVLSVKTCQVCHCLLMADWWPLVEALWFRIQQVLHQKHQKQKMYWQWISISPLLSSITITFKDFRFDNKVVISHTISLEKQPFWGHYKRWFRYILFLDLCSVPQVKTSFSEHILKLGGSYVFR